MIPFVAAFSFLGLICLRLYNADYNNGKFCLLLMYVHIPLAHVIYNVLLSFLESSKFWNGSIHFVLLYFANTCTVTINKIIYLDFFILTSYYCYFNISYLLWNNQLDFLNLCLDKYDML